MDRKVMKEGDANSLNLRAQKRTKRTIEKFSLFYFLIPGSGSGFGYGYHTVVHNNGIQIPDHKRLRDL